MKKLLLNLYAFSHWAKWAFTMLLSLTAVLNLHGAICPEDLATTTAPVVSITNSTCKDRALIPSGGKVAAPQTACPETTTLQYSTDESNWTSTLPTYDQKNVQTIYTRCTCDDDHTVSSETASVTTTPDVCPSYAFNQYCWDDITPAGGPFLGTDRIGEDEQATYLSAHISNTDKKIYKYDGIIVTNITPPGGPWREFYYLYFDSLGNTYFSMENASRNYKMYKYDGTNITCWRLVESYSRCRR